MSESQTVLIIPLKEFEIETHEGIIVLNEKYTGSILERNLITTIEERNKNVKKLNEMFPNEDNISPNQILAKSIVVYDTGIVSIIIDEKYKHLTTDFELFLGLRKVLAHLPLHNTKDLSMDHLNEQWHLDVMAIPHYRFYHLPHLYID